MTRNDFTPLRQLTLALFLTLPIASSALAACNSAITPNAPGNRYQDHGNGTVTDLQTGLMWQQCSLGLSGAGCTTGAISTFTWAQALQQAENLNSSGGFGGYSDWRLPNRKELESLVEEACYNIAINSDLFPNTTNSAYWSSSPNAGDSNQAWYVSFLNGASSNGNRSDYLHVRLVRGGQ